MYWHHLTSPEIEQTNREIPVVIPLGSCEQHGGHLPLFVDTLQIEEITSRVNESLGEGALILPVLWIGSSHHHMDFPGTISVRPALYSEIIQEMARSLLNHGFRRLLFLNGHGGNYTPASQALGDLIATDDRADASQIALASWWSLAREQMAPERHAMTTPRLTHACEYETSLVLAIREDLVKLSRLDPSHIEKERPWASDRRWEGRVEGFHRFHRWTSSGHMGTPEHASPQKGESLLTAVTESVVDFIKDFRTWPMMPSMPPRKGTQ